MTTVSVVMATYNRLSQLHSCLRAISRQSGDIQLEVCVVNDGGLSIAPVIAEFPNLSISCLDESVNRGQVTARSLALQLAKGTYVALCDDDDRWLPQHLSSVIQAMQLGKAAWAYSDAELVVVRRQGHEVTVSDRTPFAWLNAQNMLNHFNPIVPSSVVYERAVHTEIGDFDPQMGHYWDWDWWLRLAQLTTPVRVPSCHVLYSMDYDGHNLSANPDSMRPDLQHLISKHHLGRLPSMNFSGMVKAPELTRELAETTVVWDGEPDIWR